jgi:multidrug resistance efflux pump
MLKYKMGYLLVAGIGVLALGSYWGRVVWDHQHVSTDDAQIDTDVVPVSTTVSGKITKVWVEDHQRVKKGDLLAEIDSREFASKVKQAAAEVEVARGQSNKLHEAEALLEQAQLHLEGTKIFAPMEGQLSKVAVEVGQFVQPGQWIVQVLSESRFVIANFKETQIGALHPGLKTEITVDAYPGLVWEGQVESLSPATGSRFSLLPPDNATGNFVKVVQRVPVKIRLSPSPHMGQLRAGLSAEVTVRL